MFYYAESHIYLSEGSEYESQYGFVFIWFTRFMANFMAETQLNTLLSPQGSRARADEKAREGAGRAERRPQQRDAEHAVRLQQSTGTAQRQDLRPSDTVRTYRKYTVMPSGTCRAKGGIFIIG